MKRGVNITGFVLFLIGTISFLVCLVLLAVNVAAKKPLKKEIGIVLTISFLLFVNGIAASIPTKKTVPPVQQVMEETEDDETQTYDPADDIINPVEQTKEVGGGVTPLAVTAPSGEMRVHFIDVGQGDSILIQTPTQNILIDGGNRGSTTLNYLQSHGVTSLDLLIGTHPHADHIGGLITVLQSIPVKEVMDPGMAHTTKTFEDYLTIIDQKDIKFIEGRTGMTRDLGAGASMQILHPSSPSSSDLNNASIVAKITFGSISLLLAGDVEGAAENQIINRGIPLGSTILKVAHHGSNTSTTKAFLSAVSPEAAVIMCGSGNSYGHPHEETLQRLAAANVEIYRTDIHGTIIITTDGQTYAVNKQPFAYVQQQQPPPPPPTVSTTTSGSFVGSINSNKYHYPSCNHAARILPQNEVWFGSVAAARAAGYVACKVCRPHDYTQPSYQQPSSQWTQPYKQQIPETQTVYITETGLKYHRAGCQYLSRSMESISLENARSQGYGACSVCRP